MAVNLAPRKCHIELVKSFTLNAGGFALQLHLRVAAHPIFPTLARGRVLASEAQCLNC